MSDPDLVQTILNSQKAFQQTVCEMMRTWNLENKDAQKRIHERLDQLLNKEAVSGADCEQRRNSCKDCTNTKIDKAKGIPTWCLVVGSIGASLLTGMAMFIITHVGG